MVLLPTPTVAQLDACAPNSTLYPLTTNILFTDSSNTWNKLLYIQKVYTEHWYIRGQDGSHTGSLKLSSQSLLEHGFLNVGCVATTRLW